MPVWTLDLMRYVLAVGCVLFLIVLFRLMLAERP